jgi:hypothetical protein
MKEAALTRPSLLIATATLLFVGSAQAGGITSCGTSADSSQATSSPQVISSQPYREGRPGFALTARDMEFLWDNSYGPISADVQATLNRFNQAIVFLQGTNPIATDARNLEAVYNLLRRQGFNWNPTDASDSTAYKVGRTSAGYNSADRAHTDLYIFNPTVTGNDTLPNGQYPAAFLSDNEDVSTVGRSLGDVKHDNSVMIQGPAPGQAIDLTGTGWTSPNRVYQLRVLHEIQHSLPGSVGGGSDSETFSELWSAAAEAINGIRDTTRSGEIPYTWPLLSPKAKSPPLRGANSNYAAK